MRRILALLAMSFLAASAALAAEADKAGAPGTNVEMPFLIAPLSKDGKLLGYAYIQSHLVATSQSAAIAIRDKLAFIQDAYVRDVNAKPIGLASDPAQVDLPGLNDRLTADAQRIVGPGTVAHMDFTDGHGKITIQFSPLHPDGTTLTLVPPSERAPAAQSGQQASPATSEPATAATP